MCAHCTSAHVLAGVFLGLEIQEGAERHAHREYYDEYGHSAATSLRLLKPYFRTISGPGREMPTRVHSGDSWFMGVNQSEAIFIESGKVIYPFGDDKTNTSRFPKDELAALCGPDSGDWATITTQFHLSDDSFMDIMGVAHRRGPEVHTFVAAAGLTTLGRPQAHKADDLDVTTEYVIACKCPKVFNDWTLAQPKFDRHNRLRQDVLAIEKRFVTESFPLRLFSTCVGMMFVDAYYAYLYLNKLKIEDLPFRMAMPAMRKMAYALMHNNLDAIEEGTKDSDDLFNIDGEEEEDDGDTMSDEQQSPDRNLQHQAILLRHIPGYSGAS